MSFHSSKLLIDPSDTIISQQIQHLTGKARLGTIAKLSSGKTTCLQTGGPLPKYSKVGLKLFMEFGERSAENIPLSGERKQQLHASEAMRILSGISNEDAQIIGLDPKWARPEWLLVSVMPVPPPHVRPSVAMNATARCEDDLTHKISDIVKANIAVGNAVKMGEPEHVIEQFVTLLQYHVATFVNNELAYQPQAQQRSGKPLKTIRQRLVGKEGRVRGNLMGKRVDFSARTVITADPNLSLDQVGVPRSIALNLTVPEKVTSFNMTRMRELVLNGPSEHPGARYIVRDDGQRLDLRYVRESNITLRKGWIVERHLNHDDVVLFNRQPSLHKMSIMGHRVRVLDWSTFRMNLSVTSPYNADFDGDEMNLHVPQSLLARAEAETMMMVNKVVVSPQSNRPVMSIIQDSLLSTCKLTKRDVFIEKDEVMNMMMWIDNWEGHLPIPAVMIPDRNQTGKYTGYWTGKQVFSQILPRVNLIRMSKLHKETEQFPDELVPHDTYVYIKEGEVLSGTIDKNTLGTGAGGLIHVVFNEHGPETIRVLFNQIQKLSNYWILHHGFTVGVGDTIPDKETLQSVNEILRAAKDKVADLVKQGQRGELQIQPGRTMQESFEDFVNMRLNTARDNAGKKAESSLTVENNFKATVTSGSKGSFINISQIMACVGQTNVEGKRIPYGFRHRTLPHFAKDDLGPESRGFVENSYLKGLSPQEFYFHAMAGREGLIDTACKTAETGYIQRRLVKALEDIMVRYDGTVRNSRGDIVQFLYGEDGMDAAFVENQKFDNLTLNTKKFEDMFKFKLDDLDFGYHRGKPYLEPSVISKVSHDIQARDLFREEFEQLAEDQERLREIMWNREPSGARAADKTLPLPVNFARMIWNAQGEYNIDKSKPTDLDPRVVVDKVRKLLKRLIIVSGEDHLSIEAQENATLLFKIKARAALASKVVTLKHRLSVEAFDWLIGEVEARFNRAKVNAGEMCGVLAAQSIGEPATQMTLNTFHYAGVSSKNVTLGVPRLKEIINGAKNIKTPSLTVHLDDDHRYDKKSATEVLAHLEYTTLKDISVETRIVYDPNPGVAPYSVIEEDQEFVESYYQLPDEEIRPELLSPWLLRLELNANIMQFKGITFEEITEKIKEEFGDDLVCIHNDENADKAILRLRLVREKAPVQGEGEEEEAAEDDMDEDVFLRKLETALLTTMPLRGLENVKKVFIRDDKKKRWDNAQGFVDNREWVLDTEGTNLLGVMAEKGVDYTRTFSNDCLEIYSALGIEALRRSLLNEMRAVISFDGSYVNYRHLAILVDVMTYKGILLPITRHGIGKNDSGPLQRCSFEQTVEVLMDAASFAEHDPLTGVSENIMMGNLAPLGTGHFSLYLNEDMLRHAVEIEEEAEDEEMMHRQHDISTPATPMAATPAPFSPGAFSPGSASPANAAFSPAPGAAFSPAPGSPGGAFSPSSPAYSPSSPAYSPSSPAYSPSSPAYSPSSPAYSPSSPAYSPSSPAYSPSSPAYSPSSPAYSPSSPAYSPSSPAYSPSSPAYSPSSPAYSPSSPAYSPSSPAYSPSSPAYSPSSPAYSPSSPAYSPSSPAYSPSSPAYSPSSPAYSPSSPAYSPSSPAYSPSSPAYSPSSPAYSPSSPAYSPSSPAYSPSSPAYSPSSPAYSPSSPAYSPSSPAYSPSSPAYSPSSPAYSTEDKEGKDKKKK